MVLDCSGPSLRLRRFCFFERGPRKIAVIHGLLGAKKHVTFAARTVPLLVFFGLKKFLAIIIVSKPFCEGS